MINYPKNFGEIFGKVGPMYLNIIVMLLAISVYQAVFNNTGMVGAISDGLIKICPKFMLEYIHIILLLLCVIIITLFHSRSSMQCIRCSSLSGQDLEFRQ